MNKIIEVSLSAAIFLGIQTVISTTSLAQTSGNQSPTSNQMSELVSKWGFELTKCQENSAEIKHDLTGEIACVVPNQTVGAGKFIYNSANNEIRPVNPQQTSNSPPAPATTVNNRNNPQKNPAPASETDKSKIEQIEFTFNNSYDYGACIDAILLAYEQREVELENTKKNECANNVFKVFGNNLSKETALQLIKSADNHATKVLEDKLYPSLGLRRRVAIAVGYIYDIDKNNDEVLKYLN
jgi:hypothetical protein